MGRIRAGVATVRSTARQALALCAISAAPAMSVTSQVGLAEVSIQMSLVLPGRMAAASASISVVSTNSTSSPQAMGKSTSYLRSAQYMIRDATT